MCHGNNNELKIQLKGMATFKKLRMVIPQHFYRMLTHSLWEYKDKIYFKNFQWNHKKG